MPKFALLSSPSHNRVYGSQSARLTVAELTVLSERMLGSRVHGAFEREIAGVPYVGFESDELGPREVEVLSVLSAALALFEVVDGLLRLVGVAPVLKHGDDLVTIQRYPGKTNELFTKLLLNVTVACSDSGAGFPGTRIRVFDPLCGRGTTLNQALLYGFDAFGIDIDRRDVEQYVAFLTTWLRDKRYKHSTRRSTVNRTGKAKAVRVEVDLAPDKGAMRSEGSQRVEVVADDTRLALDHFRRSSFDVVVSDLPYGIQHGSQGAELRRGPAELLAESLGAWVRLMRPGAAIGLAFNARVLDRPALADLLVSAGLRVQDLPDFEHRVDASISRDLIVARKP